MIGKIHTVHLYTRVILLSNITSFIKELTGVPVTTSLVRNSEA